MKNKLMLAIVLAGLCTAAYRFLPTQMQARLDSQVHKIAELKTIIPNAAANTEHKKYVLDIPDTTTPKQSNSDKGEVADAYLTHQQDVQVRDQGEVVKILSDDTDGSKHQRFIVKVREGITVLIAHNINLAHRINRLNVGDTVYFYGEYEWNEKGGVVHWTHRDPHGHHIAGWIKHNGVTYQ